MTDRPDREKIPAVQPSGHAVTKDDGPCVIVVPYRAGRVSAKLLPPVLLVVLGAGFLAYRARSSDWRGASSLFETRPTPAASKNPPRAKATEPTVVILVPPVIQEKVKETLVATEMGPEKPKSEGDPLDEIRRESEKTRERIAELESFKEQEARKLEAGPTKSGRAPRPFVVNDFGLPVVPVPPEEIERRLRAQTEQLRLQIDAMARLQLQQIERMAAMQRDIFGDAGRLPVPAPSPLPRPEAPSSIPDHPREAGHGAVARIRPFRDPKGRTGFRLEFQRPRPSRENENDTPPPPPKPRGLE